MKKVKKKQYMNHDVVGRPLEIPWIWDAGLWDEAEEIVGYLDNLSLSSLVKLMHHDELFELSFYLLLGEYSRDHGSSLPDMILKGSIDSVLKDSIFIFRGSYRICKDLLVQRYSTVRMYVRTVRIGGTPI